MRVKYHDAADRRVTPTTLLHEVALSLLWLARAWCRETR